MRFCSNAVLSLVLVIASTSSINAFTPTPFLRHTKRSAISTDALQLIGTCETRSNSSTALHAGGNLFRPRQPRKDDDEEDDDEEDDEDDDIDDEDDSYKQSASSEFTDSKEASSSGLAPVGRSSVDWGGEYGKLRERVGDIESGQSGPSKALFRIMTAKTPNEAIASFVNEANPEVVAAMSGAVTSLLGGLSNPNAGVETIVKANGEKLGSLCFQLQMTGYMFRNAEYVLAIKELMNIDGTASLSDYKEAFDRLDSDGSGYIESSEVEDLLSDVYDGDIPIYEVTAFLKFFDSNQDGRISWAEFEKGLGAMTTKKASERMKRVMNPNATAAALPGTAESEDNDDDEELFGEPNVVGKVEVELKNGKVIEIEAKEYIDELKKEAEILKEALRQEKSGGKLKRQNKNGMASAPGMASPPTPEQEVGGIAGYIASLQGDVQSLTKGISPEIVEAMKLLIDYVIDGGPGGRGKKRKDAKLEMEIPGSALQQLALWQLVLGYKLREAEATGEYRQMLE